MGLPPTSKEPCTSKLTERHGGAHIPEPSMNKRPPSISGLYWSIKGEVACEGHAPARHRSEQHQAVALLPCLLLLRYHKRTLVGVRARRCRLRVTPSLLLLGLGFGVALRLPVLVSRLLRRVRSPQQRATQNGRLTTSDAGYEAEVVAVPCGRSRTHHCRSCRPRLCRIRRRRSRIGSRSAERAGASLAWASRGGTSGRRGSSPRTPRSCPAAP